MRFLFEVSKPWKIWDTFESFINFGCRRNLHAPVNEVIFKYTLMQLMEDVRCKARKDVAVREGEPKWLPDCTQTLFVKGLYPSSRAFLIENY